MDETNEKDTVEVKEEASGEEGKRPSNLMVYIPVVVFVVIVVIVGVVLRRGRSETGQLTTEKEAAQTIFREGALAERKNVILITDFSKNESIPVDYVLIENNGYVAVHDEVDGKPGEVIGVSKIIASGETSNFNVILNREIQEGEILFAILHFDDGDGVFNFPGPDGPIFDENRNIIMSMFKVGASKELNGEATQSAETGQ